MGRSDYLTAGWSYTLIGAVLFVCGVGSLLLPDSGKVYLGAAVVGAILFARGVYLLHQGYSIQTSAFRLETATPPEGAGQLYERDIREGKVFTEVTCEECGQEYVYSPLRVAEARSAHLGQEVATHVAVEALLRGVAVAPCPRCGRIQRDMVPVAREEAPVSLGLWAGIVLLFAAAILVAVAMNVETARMRDGVSDPTPYWIADGICFALGAALLAWGVVSGRSWDPNSLPKDERLRLAARVSLPKDVYEIRRLAR